MNNKRLDKFSDKFEADTGETIEKRCFFLFAGKDLNQVYKSRLGFLS